MSSALDAFDYQALPLALAAITATFALTAGEAGLIAELARPEYREYERTATT
jgi:hypothetical protein